MFIKTTTNDLFYSNEVSFNNGAVEFETGNLKVTIPIEILLSITKTMPESKQQILG
jgi:hypothetical protein